MTSTGKDTSTKSDGHRALRLSEPLLRRTIAALTLSALAAITALSQGSVTDFVQRWFSTCVIIVEVEKQATHMFQLKLYIAGEAPKMLPLSFVALDGRRIERITMLGGASDGSSPLLNHHPQARMVCPGSAFCDQDAKAGAQANFQINVAPVSSNFEYIYQVELSGSPPAGSISPPHVYINYIGTPEDLKVCRAEKPSILNSTVWLPSWILISVAVIVIFMATLSIQAMTGHKETQ